MKTESTLSNLFGCLKYFLFVLFAIGIIWNWDGITILINNKDYKSGTLENVRITTDYIGMGKSLIAKGTVDSVQTGLVINERLDSIPVWYRKNGELTILKYPDENEFPTGRVALKLLLYILLFNGPFIAAWILEVHFRRKSLKG